MSARAKVAEAEQRLRRLLQDNRLLAEEILALRASAGGLRVADPKVQQAVRRAFGAPGGR